MRNWLKATAALVVALAAVVPVLTVTYSARVDLPGILSFIDSF